MRNKGKPHILCVIYGTELYGSERGTIEALCALRDEGVQISVVGSGRKPKGGQTGEAIAELGFPLFLIPFGSHLKRSWMVHNRDYRKMIFGRIWRCSRKFKRIRKELKPTHIMVCGTSPLPFILPALAFNRTKIIYRMGDAPVVSSKIHFPLWKWLVRRAEIIVTISDFMSSILVQHASRNLDSRKIHVIRNIAPQRPRPIDQESTASLQRTKRPFQVVFVGQVTEKKGVGPLTEALLELDDPNIGCWILGEFLGNKEFDERIQNTLRTSSSRTKIEMVGYVSDPRPYYKAADWHIAPSTYEEPLGNVVQEAQLQGTPSIVTNKGGLPELIEHEKTGWLLETPTPEAIIRCVQALQGSPDWVDAAESAIHTKSAEFGNVEFRQAWIQALSTS